VAGTRYCPNMSDIASGNQLVELLARCALRDREAFAALYDATSAKLFSVIQRILGQEAVAEETLQEVYLNIWQRAGDYHAGKGQPMTWLISVARYRAIDALRSQQRRVPDGSHDAVDTLEERSSGPQKLAQQAGEAVALDECLDQLADERRQCLQLAYCEGYTHEELSQRLGSPIGTIKSWIRRSLLAVRDCLEVLRG